jgi:hypothetical protein
LARSLPSPNAFWGSGMATLVAPQDGRESNLRESSILD